MVWDDVLTVLTEVDCQCLGEAKWAGEFNRRENWGREKCKDLPTI